MLNRHAKRNALDAGMIRQIRSKVQVAALGGFIGLTSYISFPRNGTHLIYVK